MKVHHQELSIAMPGRACRDITPEVRAAVRASAVRDGSCSVFILHTSASLTLAENADPEVLRDLERFMARLVPDGDALFAHTDEGPDDMPAHVRSVLTRSDLCLPVRAGGLVLGAWQGVFLWEHRLRPQRRSVLVTVCGV